ncbi:hypothetical protein acsn021_02990 [Anaerocolumna cellulosilytica]|uniref:Uncharacterized protein n=1 Tax=Anaerocolumna cellulosilytica TaxID=433286 RepID=A0A6S6R0C5_9FIRM|nr:hypothetical protein [Anaerocolumna cellulosilytica]MBB5196869.1 hypothetical protein [Anaerocolumna cellulosilytica]BCJ92730.1 hypothetical protein acsn021_02990 [Anaerocolumna cellulosilytica]
MSKKKIIIASSSVILGITLIGIYYWFFSVPWISNNKFIQFQGYVANDINTTYPLSLPFIANRIVKNEINIEDIVDVKLKDSKLLKVKEFHLSYGEKRKNYQFKTLTLTIGFDKCGIEDITNIEIILKNGEVINYPIGSLKFEIIDTKNEEESYLKLNSHIAMNQNISFYELDIVNQSTDLINITDIKVDIPELKIENMSYWIEPKDSFLKRYKIDKVNKESSDFFIIKPLIKYRIDNKQKIFLPEGTTYGTMSIDEKMVLEILKKK